MEYMKYHGISGMTYSWLGYYLSDRPKCVSPNGFSPDFVHEKQGVPQGYALGLLLLLLNTYQ